MASDSRPNVLLLMVDDMNPWMGCLRNQPFCQPQVRTPNLDRFAENAVLFTHAHCPAPICNPSRTAVLTGMHPTTTGVYGNYCWWRPNLPEAASLPEYFRSQGYLAGGCGKTFHHCYGFNPPEQWDFYREQAFDDTWDRKNRVNYPHITPEDPPLGHPLHGFNYFVHEFDWGSLPKSQREYDDQKSVEFARAFLASEHDKPFFLACGFFRPHLPWYAPSRFFDWYSESELDLPAESRESDWSLIPEYGRKLASVGPQEQDQYGELMRRGKFHAALRAYLASISFADDLAGQVIEALDRGPAAGNTIVVFVGDHGFHIGEKRHFGKQALWRESTQVPFLIRAPGLTSGGRMVEDAVSSLDISATIAELCGLEALPQWDSRSLVPELRGSASDGWERPVLCSFGSQNHAIVTKDWRYIRYEDGGEELYSLVHDPLELSNLANRPEHVGTIARLSKLLPENPAQPAKGFEAFDFDWREFSWKEKAEEKKI